MGARTATKRRDTPPISSATMVVLVLVALLAMEFFRRPGDPNPSTQGPPSTSPPGTLQPTNRNVRFGLPAPASADPSNRDGFLVDRPQYVLSYNEPRRVPNWVAWQLIAADVGKADRGPFSPDPLLPAEFAHVASSVYNNSGFDRGHICPSKDRSDSEANNDPTFYTTNIAPQAPLLNQRAWERLEAYCRELAQDGNELQIVAGTYGTGGTGKEGYRDQIGSGRLQVAVPSHFWKVILVVPQPGSWPGPQARTIAVVMPNNQDAGDDWTRFRVAPRQIEQFTGYRFFPALPPEVAEPLMTRLDDTAIRTARAR